MATFPKGKHYILSSHGFDKVRTLPPHGFLLALPHDVRTDNGSNDHAINETNQPTKRAKRGSNRRLIDRLHRIRSSARIAHRFERPRSWCKKRDDLVIAARSMVES